MAFILHYVMFNTDFGLDPKTDSDTQTQFADETGDPLLKLCIRLSCRERNRWKQSRGNWLGAKVGGQETDNDD